LAIECIRSSNCKNTNLDPSDYALTAKIGNIADNAGDLDFIASTDIMRSDETFSKDTSVTYGRTWTFDVTPANDANYDMPDSFSEVDWKCMATDYPATISNYASVMSGAYSSVSYYTIAAVAPTPSTGSSGDIGGEESHSAYILPVLALAGSALSYSIF
jgi:hypothetical protein